MSLKTRHHQSRILNTPATSALVAFGACWVLSWSALPASAATRNWKGNDSGYWSNPNNWDPVGVPQPGDDLQFGHVSDSNGSMVNDLPNLTVSSLDFQMND
jgi:hypothetical protein